MTTKRPMLPSQLTALAYRLADEWAEVIFHSDCPRAGDIWWYTIPPPPERSGEMNRALRYLRARGMLVQNPDDRKAWKVKGD